VSPGFDVGPASEGELKEAQPSSSRPMVQGSVEAILGFARTLPQGEVRCGCCSRHPGDHRKPDVDLAAARGGESWAQTLPWPPGARRRADANGARQGGDHEGDLTSCWKTFSRRWGLTRARDGGGNPGVKAEVSAVFSTARTSRCRPVHSPAASCSANLQGSGCIAPKQVVLSRATSTPCGSQQRTTSKEVATRFRVRHRLAIVFANWQDKDRVEAYKAGHQRRHLKHHTERRETPQAAPAFGSNCWAMAAAPAGVLTASLLLLAGSESRAPLARARAASLAGARRFFCLQPCSGSSPLLMFWVTVCCCRQPGQGAQ